MGVLKNGGLLCGILKDLYEKFCLMTMTSFGPIDELSGDDKTFLNRFSPNME
jgi:hypothetical protein